MLQPDPGPAHNEAEHSLGLTDFASALESLPHALRQAALIEKGLLEARRDPQTPVHRRQMLCEQSELSIARILKLTESQESGVQPSRELLENLQILRLLCSQARLTPPAQVLSPQEESLFSTMAYEMRQRLNDAATQVLNGPATPLLKHCISGTIEAIAPSLPDRLFSPENISADDVLNAHFPPCRLFCTSGVRTASGSAPMFEALRQALPDIVSVQRRIQERLDLCSELHGILAAAGVVGRNGVFEASPPSRYFGKGHANARLRTPADCQSELRGLFLRFPEEASGLPALLQDFIEDKALYDQMLAVFQTAEREVASAIDAKALKRLCKTLDRARSELDLNGRTLWETWESLNNGLALFAGKLGLIHGSQNRLLTEREVLAGALESTPAETLNHPAKAEDIAMAASLVSCLKSGLANASALEDMQLLLSEKIERLEREDISALEFRKEQALRNLFNQLEIPSRGVTQHLEDHPAPHTEQGLKAMEELMRCTAAYAVLQLSSETKPFYVRFLQKTGEAGASSLDTSANLAELPGSAGFWSTLALCLKK